MVFIGALIAVALVVMLLVLVLVGVVVPVVVARVLRVGDEEREVKEMWVGGEKGWRPW